MNDKPDHADTVAMQEQHEWQAKIRDDLSRATTTTEIERIHDRFKDDAHFMSEFEWVKCECDAAKHKLLDEF